MTRELNLSIGPLLKELRILLNNPEIRMRDLQEVQYNAPIDPATEDEIVVYLPKSEAWAAVLKEVDKRECGR